MRYVLGVCVFLALWAAVLGQQPGVEPRVVPPPAASEQSPPDLSGKRLSQLLRTAGELQQAGRPEEAAVVLKQADRERQALLRHLDALQAEMERIRLATGAMPQVVVHVQVLEVSLTKLRRLNFDLSAISGLPDAKPNAPRKDGGVRVVDGGQAQRLLDALRKENLGKVLAMPTLATISGKMATVSIGSEVPMPRPQADGTTTIAYEHCGTQCSVTPEVLNDRQVRLEIHLRVSELAPGEGVRVGKEVMPGLRAREVQSGMELASGQTMVLTGMVQKRTEMQRTRPAWFGDIPLLGDALKNTSEEVNETAMLVFLRPEIVAPRGGEVRPAAATLPAPAAKPEIVRPVNGPR
jgi:Flp pilus assembly secretin CpaC